MAQFNLKVPASFRRQVQLLMKLRGYASRSEAIRAAVEDAVARARAGELAREPGLLAGRVEIADDFDAPLPDDVLGTFTR